MYICWLYFYTCTNGLVIIGIGKLKHHKCGQWVHDTRSFPMWTISSGGAVFFGGWFPAQDSSYHQDDHNFSCRVSRNELSHSTCPVIYESYTPRWTWNGWNDGFDSPASWVRFKYSVGHSKTTCMGVSLHLLFRWSNCVMASDVCLLFMYGINLLCFFIASKCSSGLGGCLSTIQYYWIVLKHPPDHLGLEALNTFLYDRKYS